MRLTDLQEGRLRTLSRHSRFPKILTIVEEFCESRIDWSGQPKQELAMEIYMKPLVGRLTDAILPKCSDGKEQLLPVINRFRPWGSSDYVNFTTVRQCYRTQKSQIDQVVLDTQAWNQSVAHQIEASDAVSHYVRNDHLDFSIPCEFMGVSHGFFPDFIVKLANGVSLILEVKGIVDERKRAKFEAAKRWCRAVNNWGKMGTWAFHVSKDSDHVQKELKYLNQKQDLETTTEVS